MQYAIEINAPYISSLTIMGDFFLFEIRLLDVSSLVKAELNYTKLSYGATTRKAAREWMLKSFILRLKHVKELKIGISCYTVFSRLEANGFVFPSNLKVVQVDYPVYDTDSEQVIALNDSSDSLLAT